MLKRKKKAKKNVQKVERKRYFTPDKIYYFGGTYFVSNPAIFDDIHSLFHR